MKIALPLEDEKLCSHFGHCKQFAFFDSDGPGQKITEINIVDAPPHEPGALPEWLAEKGVDVVIAGGLGSRAYDLLVAKSIKVIVGAPSEKPNVLVEKYLSGGLSCGENACDH